MRLDWDHEARAMLRAAITTTDAGAHASALRLFGGSQLAADGRAVARELLDALADLAIVLVLQGDTAGGGCMFAKAGDAFARSGDGDGLRQCLDNELAFADEFPAEHGTALRARVVEVAARGTAAWISREK
jgi:hypothetical protein